jgi:hypothetical protein
MAIDVSVAPTATSELGVHAMRADLKPLIDFLAKLGIDRVSHTEKTYLAHLVNVHRLLEASGCDEAVCRAGLFHSIYGTEKFQGFKLPLSQRADLAALVGPRAERLAYWNCLMDRASLDALLWQEEPPFILHDRETGEPMELTRQEYDDLCRVHLYDWLEQAPRSRFGWNYRRAAYRRMAERLGEHAVRIYDDVFSHEPTAAE